MVLISFVSTGGKLQLPVPPEVTEVSSKYFMKCGTNYAKLLEAPGCSIMPVVSKNNNNNQKSESLSSLSLSSSSSSSSASTASFTVGSGLRSGLNCYIPTLTPAPAPPALVKDNSRSGSDGGADSPSP